MIGISHKQLYLDLITTAVISLIGRFQGISLPYMLSDAIAGKFKGGSQVNLTGNKAPLRCFHDALCGSPYRTRLHEY